MKNKLTKPLSLILTAFTVFLLLAPAGMAASIRGLPVDTNEASADEFCWDATTFGAFCYPVNKHNNFVTLGWGEELYYEDKAGSNNGPLGSSAPGNNVIDEEELFYKTVQYSSKYTLVSELGLDTNTSEEMLGGMFYYMLPWFGKPYIAVENDATQLAAVVCKQGGSDKKTLKSGESWELGKGYTLTVHQVDVDGNKVWFSLYKDGEELESGIIETDGTVESQTFTATADFGDADDQLYFMTYVDKVFMGAVDSLAVFKYTWLIDKDNVMLIKTGDEYQGLEVDTAEASEITLTNKDTITLDLDKDKKNYFTDSWYFQTSDEGKGSTSSEGYIIYPAKDLDTPGSYTLRGIPLDTNEASADEFCWNATTFGAFCYPVNKHNNFVTKGWGEELYYEDKAGSNNGPLGSSAPGNNVIDEEELIYKTVQYSSKYTLVSELGLDTNTSEEMLGGMFYYMLPWFGKPYIAVENDATQLAAVVCKQGGSDKKTLKSGESWELGKGYTLTVHQVDVDGNKVWFSLYKDGEELESGIIETDGTVESQTFIATTDFGDTDDQLYFITYVDKVFMGAVDSLAVFKYTWLIDKDNVMLIKTDDEYQGLEVDTAEASEITLTNKDTITLDLDKDKKNYFTDSWYFQTSDEGKGSSGNGYIIYPAMDVTIEDETVSESVESDVEEVVEVTPEDTEPTADADGSKSSPASQVEASDSAPTESDEESSEESPGFGLLTCILGLCAGFVRRK